MAKFYFTYDTNPEFPYQGGWSEIEADSGIEAIIAFQRFHPNREGSPFYNFYFQYSEAEWKSTPMMQKNDFFGHGCRERIVVTNEREKFAGAEGNVLIVEHISYSRTIIDNT